MMWETRKCKKKKTGRDWQCVYVCVAETYRQEGKVKKPKCSPSLLAHRFIWKNPTGPDKSLIGSAPLRAHSLIHTYTLALTHTLTVPLALSSARLHFSSILCIKWYFVLVHFKFFSRLYLVWLCGPLAFDSAWPIWCSYGAITHIQALTWFTITWKKTKNKTWACKAECIVSAQWFEPLFSWTFWIWCHKLRLKLKT